MAKPSPNTEPNVPVKLRPEQAHLERQDRAGHHADREQRDQHPAPPPGQRQVHVAAGAQRRPLAEQDQHRERHPEADQRDVHGERERLHLPGLVEVVLVDRRQCRDASHDRLPSDRPPHPPPGAGSGLGGGATGGRLTHQKPVPAMTGQPPVRSRTAAATVTARPAPGPPRRPARRAPAGSRRPRCARPPADRGSCSARRSSPCSARSSPPSRPPPPRPPRRCRSGAAPGGGPAAGVHWTPCGDRLECATVPVPLDWSRPHGPAISLAVMRHLATDPAHRIGSLLLNPGGPGDSGVDEVASRGAFFDALTGGRFDVVSWDPARQRPQRAGVLLRHRGRAGRVLGRRGGADHQGRRAALPGQDRRARPAVRAAQRRAARAHLDGRPGPRPRPPAPAGRRPAADLLRRVQRHADGPDVREHVPGPGPGDGAGRDRRPDRVQPGGWRRRWRTGSPTPTWCGTKFLGLCQAAGPDRCALAGHGPVAPRVDAFLARLRRAPMETRPAR